MCHDITDMVGLTRLWVSAEGVYVYLHPGTPVEFAAALTNGSSESCILNKVVFVHLGNPQTGMPAPSYKVIPKKHASNSTFISYTGLLKSVNGHLGIQFFNKKRTDKSIYFFNTADVVRFGGSSFYHGPPEPPWQGQQWMHPNLAAWYENRSNYPNVYTAWEVLHEFGDEHQRKAFWEEHWPNLWLRKWLDKTYHLKPEGVEPRDYEPVVEKDSTRQLTLEG